MAQTDNTPSLPLIVVAGATGSGKSAFALRLAEICGGAVINADSMQVYADLPILTAIPDSAERRRAPHEGYAILDGGTRCSVGRWLEITRGAVASVRMAGKIPILTGGTGMYIRAALEGITPLPESDPAIRAEAAADHGRLGGAAFRAELARYDAALAGRLKDGDSQRLIRGMEVIRMTGQPLSIWQKAPPEGALEGVCLNVLIAPPRDVLYGRIDSRFPAMLEAGAAAEAEAFLARRLDASLPLMKAVGLRPMAGLLAGDMSREQAIEAACQETRRLAKRQMTWFRHQYQAQAIWDGTDSGQYLKRFFEEILSKIIK